ncbi:MAG: hypothetical protein ACJAT7_003479, partial [Psychromonas sp.]
MVGFILFGLLMRYTFGKNLISNLYQTIPIRRILSLQQEVTIVLEAYRKHI